ncbi:unnamed protein product [Calypogeia fissa]
MGRAPCCDKKNVKKGPWSPEEDAKLKHFIQTKGTGGNWITLPSKAGLRRCGKSCRLRWINYLRPDIKHGGFTEEEEKAIIELHGKVGSRWSLIAAQLEGRTDNDIKNYWNTRLKKKLAEKGMNTGSSSSSLQQRQHPQQLQQQQHRGYHMQRGAGVPMFVNVPQQSRMSKDQLLDQLDYERAQGFLEQQRGYNASQLGMIGSSFSSQQLIQWQEHMATLSVKHELPPPDVSETERFRKIQSELMDCIIPQSEGSDSIDPLQHQQSPNSPCSNFSSDRSAGYGGQLEVDSPYGDSFICNSYPGDPPPLVDVQPLTSPAAPLIPLTTALSPLEQLASSCAVSSIQKEDSASGVTSMTSLGRFGSSGLFGDLSTFSDQTSYLSDAVTSPSTGGIDRFLAVKEEIVTSDSFLSSDLMTVSSPSNTTRGLWPSRSAGWPTYRCGDGLLSAAHQSQMLSPQTVDALTEPLGTIFLGKYSGKYVL